MRSPDAAHRRVQARVPASRLRMVAARCHSSISSGSRPMRAVTPACDQRRRQDSACRCRRVSSCHWMAPACASASSRTGSKACSAQVHQLRRRRGRADCDRRSSQRHRRPDHCRCAHIVHRRNRRPFVSAESRPRRSPFRHAHSTAPAPRERRCWKSSTTSRPALSCHSPTSTPILSFIQAVNYLASTNDIVIDDLGFFGDAFDGTSVVSSEYGGGVEQSGVSDSRLLHRRRQFGGRALLRRLQGFGCRAGVDREYRRRHGTGARSPVPAVERNDGRPRALAPSRTT